MRSPFISLSTVQVRLAALSLLLGLSTQWSDAHAFKTGTHVAAANQVVDELNISLDAAGGTLEFEINGRRLEIEVTAPDAYDAVRNFPDSFAAGAMGPDGFPDPVTGQILMHGDGSDLVKNLVEQMTGVRPDDHEGHTDIFSERTGPAEYRSIDFVTAMLKFFATYAPASESERQQIIAFIMGYVSHGVGDSFAHTWVNEIAGGAWDVTEGDGLWGSFSEEVKHTAIEAMVDQLVPSHLTSVPGDQGGLERIRIQAPARFLDAFYSAQAFNSPVPPYTAGDSVGEFITHYRNFNVYNGGFFYNYLNAQTKVASTLKSWSGFSGVFDVAEAANNNVYANLGLDAAELPETVATWLTMGPNPVGWIDELTGGFVDCHAEHFGSPLPTPIGDLREALEFVGGINGRIANYTHKTEIVRRNWIKLSQCTAENMARSGGANFDPAQPNFNRDSCADLVRQGWEDESADGASGLYRGDIRPLPHVEDVIFPDLNNDERFLLDLKAAFLGEDAEDLFLLVDDPINNHSVWEQDEAIEGQNGHRSLGSNLNRMFDYIVYFAFRGDEIDEIVFPDDGGEVKNTYDDVCSAARDEGFERCLDLAFAPIAAAGRETICLADHATCTADSVRQCMQNACENACILPFGACGDVCGTGQTSSCKGTCDDLLCPFPPFVCEPASLVTCRSLCDIFNDDDRRDSCYDAAIDEAECGIEHIKCSFDNFVDTITLDNYAEELLTPVREVCDTIDEAVELVECLEGDPAQPADVQAAARRDCVVALCASQSTFSSTDCESMYDRLEDAYQDAVRVKDALSALADALKDRPAHEIVNVAFLLEDLRRSSEYRESVNDSITNARTAWLNNPPAPGAPADEVALYNRRGDAIDRWEKLLTDVAAFPGASDPIDDFADISTDAAQLINDSNDLGLIPTVIGPTAQDIYRDIGPSFELTFTPYYNTCQGMKLVPLQSSDLSTVFSTEAPGSSELLPAARVAASESKTSPECGEPGASLYCDTLLSFDDPNCLNCGPASHEPDPDRNDWVPGRSIVAFNNYDPSNSVRHVSTVFPFSNSDESYNGLYTRIFRVPASVPNFAGFDDPSNPWTSDQTELTPNFDNATEGSGSMQVEGCNGARLDSPRFSTAEWGVVGDQLKVDVFIPEDQSNPYWIGDTQVFVTVPGAGIHNQPLSWRSLTSLPRPGWSTLSFDVPLNIQDALLGDYANAQINIQLNYSGCSAPILFDHLRFDGNLREREVFHLLGSSLTGVQSNDLFGFDHVSDWSSVAPLTSQDLSVEGGASLGVQTIGYQAVRSRPFSTSEILGVTANLSLDLFLPKPQPNIYWNGDVALSLSCSNLVNSYIGPPVSLTNLFEDEFSTLEFTLTSEQIAALTSGAVGCTIEILLNTNPAGMILLDNMGFH